MVIPYTYIQSVEVRDFQSLCGQQSIPEFLTYKFFVGKSVACISWRAATHEQCLTFARDNGSFSVTLCSC